MDFFPLSSGATELVLASSSKYRASLLQRLQIPFSAAAPEVDETPHPDEAPEPLVQRLAAAKAARIAQAHPTALIIGSDQLAVCDNRLLGKPGTEARAREQLATLSGRTVHFHTGLCLLNAASGHSQVSAVDTPVTFRDLQPKEIANYVAREQPLDCAGAFKSEGLGIALFQAIGGDDPNALIGLPLIELCTMLAREGLFVLQQGIPG